MDNVLRRKGVLLKGLYRTGLFCGRVDKGCLEKVLCRKGIVQMRGYIEKGSCVEQEVV